LVERTTLPFRTVAARTGVSAATVSRHARKGGWTRPGEAFGPEHYSAEGRRLLRRRAFAERLMAMAERCLDQVGTDPRTTPAAVAKALRLARAAKEFDALDRPPKPAGERPRQGRGDAPPRFRTRR
jgi:hypothetical protein